MKQIYDNPVIEEINIAPMKSLLEDNNSPVGGDVPDTPGHED
jgi:hypothetical protein